MEVREANFKYLFVLLFFPGNFLGPTAGNQQFYLHCKSTEGAGNFVVCSLEVGIEAIQ